MREQIGCRGHARPTRPLPRHAGEEHESDRGGDCDRGGGDAEAKHPGPPPWGTWPNAAGIVGPDGRFRQTLLRRRPVVRRVLRRVESLDRLADQNVARVRLRTSFCHRCASSPSVRIAARRVVRALNRRDASVPGATPKICAADW